MTWVVRSPNGWYRREWSSEIAGRPLVEGRWVPEPLNATRWYDLELAELACKRAPNGAYVEKLK